MGSSIRAMLTVPRLSLLLWVGCILSRVAAVEGATNELPDKAALTVTGMEDFRSLSRVDFNRGW